MSWSAAGRRGAISSNGLLAVLAGRDGLGELQFFFVVAQLAVEAACRLVCRLGVQGQERCAALGGPGFGGVQQRGADAASLHAGGDGECADVGISLPGEVGLLADADDAHDLLAGDGYQDGVPLLAGAVDGRLDPFLCGSAHCGRVAPGGGAFREPCCEGKDLAAVAGAERADLGGCGCCHVMSLTCRAATYGLLRPRLCALTLRRTAGLPARRSPGCGSG